MGKNKAYMLLGAAVFVALIASLVTYNWLKKEATASEGNAQTHPVAVALTDLSWGTKLTPDAIKLVPFLKGSLPEGEYFTDKESLRDRVIITPVKANEPILRSRLDPDTKSLGGIAAVVRSDKRAMAVKVDKVIGVSGFIHPGDRVDVLATMDRNDSREPVTKIVLQNILVLAVGPELDQQENSKKPLPSDVITLELAPEEAEKLALASSEGRIQLALRSYKSTDQVDTKGETIPSLIGNTPKKASPVRRKTASVAPAPEPNDFTVEIIRGEEKSSKKFAETEKASN